MQSYYLNWKGETNTGVTIFVIRYQGKYIQALKKLNATVGINCGCQHV